MEDDLKVREILNQAADLPVEQRAAFLDQACGQDALLRAEVESLLSSLDEGGEFLADRPFSGSGAIDGRIGHYKLIEKIGEGGMGLVFHAYQERPVQREVALKIIKPGMDSQAVTARFEAERQALAMMDHSNIARVYDAGTTPAGRPYFVMELVKGIPITKYCDEKRLNPQQRLELFILICQAIQHAHQKGIIHRDLKPSNILVTESDGKQQVKVIDFGIAKAINQEQTERDAFTQTGMLLGTPEYMSPEQAGANSRETDTRSDIYSLGVILYELLTGVTPLDRQQLRQTGYEQIMRAIREIEPPRPSTRISTFGEGVASASALRRMEPRRLTRLLNGDLDVIVMKCLEKDRGRRYQTADGLAHDIQRYLSNDPILATPPSMAYVLHKFYRKHRLAISITVAFTLLLGLFLITTSVVFWILKGQASHQRDVALDALSTAQKARQAEQIARADADQKTTVATQESYAASMFAANLSVAAGNLGQADYLLSLAPINLRNWEWNYLHATANPQVQTISFPAGIDWIRYGKNDSHVLFVLGDHTVHIVNPLTGKPIPGASIQTRGHRPFAISDDLQRFIGEGKVGTLFVMDAQGNELVPIAFDKRVYVYSTIFTNDGQQFIMAFVDGSVELRDTRTATLVRQFAGNTMEVISTTFNHAHTQLLTGAMNGVAKIFELSTGKCLTTYQDPAGGWVYSTFSPDDTRVGSTTFGSDRQGMIWDASTGKELLSLVGGVHNNLNYGVDFSPDGKQIAICGGRFATIFDAQYGHELTVLRSQRNRTTGLHFFQDGSHIATSSNDNCERVYGLDPVPRPIMLGDQTHPIINAVVDPEGKTVATSTKGESQIVDLFTGKLRATINADSTNKLAADFHATGSFNPSSAHVATAVGGTILISDGVNGATFARLDPKVSDAGSVMTAFTHEGQSAVTAAPSGNIQIWNLTSGQPTASFSTGNASPAIQLAINSTDDRMIITDADQRYFLCDLINAKLVVELGPRGKVTWTTFSHDGKNIMLGDDERYFYRLDSSNGKMVERFYRGHSDILAGAFSPDDSKFLLCFQDEIVELLDLKTKKYPLMIHGHDGAILCACYSPDATRILTASQDHTARIWDANSGRELLTLRGHTAPVTSATFSPDGTKILTQSEDGTARVWDSISNEERATAR